MTITYAYEALPVAEWFRRNREIAGFQNSARAMYQTVRELVENSLDATEPYGILPNILISIKPVDESKSWYSIYVEDNGIGIPGGEIPNVFGRVFYSSKYKIKQHRGVFGLGLKMVVLYAQSTTNKPIAVRSATIRSDKIYEYKIMIDTTKNEPIIIDRREYNNKYRWHGTAVKVIIEGNWLNSKKRIEDYLRRTAIISPYAEIFFKGPDMELILKRRTTKMPHPPEEGLPHPKSVDVDTVKQMILENPKSTLMEFLMNNFDGIGEGLAKSFLEWAGLDPNKVVGGLTQEEVTYLAEKLKAYEGWRRPRADWLSPAGAELLEVGARSILGAEAVFAVTRKPSSYSGHPFIVEAAIAWGGQIPPVDKPILLRYANKIPLLYDEGADVARKVVDEFNWQNYKVKLPAPLAVLIHVCSTKVPYASAGKEAIAEISEIEEEMRLALRDAARKLRIYLSRKEREMELLNKYISLAKYVDEISLSLNIITGIDKDKLSSNLNKLIEQKLGVTIDDLVKHVASLPAEGQNVGQ
ncbi:MAG: DNA topoisomerase VI subunit B [Thermoproteus sp. AZ2]|uniref:DNA topoisomerase VI subunit B n=1 Tax=Thermoproteus sp. AZ2 TaxID=1609232 RepID=A0ACC6V108_9CREN|nr:MAG: DNA topoisomerase VI subunit B [Thermoproteus sp. AZ2]